MNVRIIFRVLGLLLLIEGVAMLLALIVSIVYQEYDSSAFFISSGINVLLGSSILYLTRNARRDIGRREGYIIVSLVWIVFSFFGSLPYVISGAIPNFTNAFFETISGFTTTGSSILADIEALPHPVARRNGYNCFVAGYFACVWNWRHAAFYGRSARANPRQN
jgi:trk system potassium uptake protein TrkH